MDNWSKYDLYQYAKILAKRIGMLKDVLSHGRKDTKKVTRILIMVQMRMEDVLDKFNNY